MKSSLDVLILNGDHWIFRCSYWNRYGCPDKILLKNTVEWKEFLLEKGFID